MFRLLREGGYDVLAMNQKTGRIYIKADGRWRRVNGTLEQHLRFHPYADVIEVDKVDGLNVEPK